MYWEQSCPLNSSAGLSVQTHESVDQVVSYTDGHAVLDESESCVNFLLQSLRDEVPKNIFVMSVALLTSKARGWLKARSAYANMALNVLTRRVSKESGWLKASAS